MPRILLPLLALVAFTLPASPASAQRGARDAEDRIERLLRDAREAYDNLELDAAESALDRAVRMGEDARLTSPTLAEAYIQRGILYHVRDKDADRAVRDFTRALQLDDRARLDPLVSTPSLERLFDDARSQARRAPPPRRDPDPPPRGYDDRRDPPPQRDPDPPARGGEDVYHQPPAKAKSGESLVLSADIDDRINRVVYRVYLFFETARSEKMQKVEMEPKGNRTFSARIPRRYMVGSTLRYYIVAEDRQGRPVGVKGTAQRPILLPIEGDLLGGADEMASGSTLGGGGGGGSGGHRYLSIGLSLGTGGGFVTRNAELQNQVGFGVSPGFAPAPFHTMVEADVWATDWLGIGAYSRIQIVEFAWLVGGRIKLSVFEGGGSEIIVRAGGGYGQVRHLVSLPGDLLDTTLEGPYHWTIGASWRYAFTDLFGLVISPDFLHLIGDSPSYHFDLNIGVTFDF